MIQVAEQRGEGEEKGEYVKETHSGNGLRHERKN
jgi:hypothetical protein